MIYEITLHLVDSFNRETTRKFRTVDGLDDAEALATVTLAADGYALVSDAGLLRATLTKVITDDNFAVTSGASIDKGATLRVRKTDGRRDVLRIVSPKAALFNSDGTIDTSHVGLLGYVAMFETGNELTFSDGEQLVTGGLIGGTLDK